jgi:hypothetical protein
MRGHHPTSQQKSTGCSVVEGTSGISVGLAKFSQYFFLVMAANAAIHGTGRSAVLEVVLAAPAFPVIDTII